METNRTTNIPEKEISFVDEIAIRGNNGNTPTRITHNTHMLLRIFIFFKNKYTYDKQNEKNSICSNVEIAIPAL